MSDIPLPAKLIAAKHEAEQAAAPQKKGWWSLGGLSGSINGVLSELDKRDIPAHWKAALKAELIERAQGDYNYALLDAHYFIEGGVMSLNVSMIPQKKLL